eukprot:TRINITY_DN43811_c0_g1_i1.p1 TRINITY_DN43811_c0_g1~~TRINITY_DN43811_c0_g1_i1.p1  ORF type:complete len:436 (-),score=79.29 TRINITY_DN43811_c0_g1_i1:33-1340(-)
MEHRGYSVVRLLGSGGQGRVYEVRDAQNQLCVLKQLPLLGGEKDRAFQEVQLLSSLQHPCIVPYLDSFLVRSMPCIPTEDMLCIVMSRCKHDLRDECVRVRSAGSRFEEPHVVSWLAQLTWGLQHLHARKFLHRDLKAQNVLLTQDDRVLLADFGMAGRLEHSEDFKRSIVGTPSSMSPEMLEGRPYGCKTDQWALGCVLYEIMSLEPPFVRCDSYAAIVAAVLQSSPLRAPGGYGAELSSALEALLARQPDKRPSSAEMLGGPLLREPFRALVQSSTKLARAMSGRIPSPLPRNVEEVEVTYESDFESYSGSDGEADEAGESSARSRGNGNLGGGWHQLHVEAEALLQPMPKLAPADAMQKVWTVLLRAVGSSDVVNQALNFLRERNPLCDGGAEDEMVLQIEIIDQFGDEGLHALPLLERYLALEALDRERKR